MVGVRCVDGSKIPYPQHHRRLVPFEHAGWTFKAFALYSTTFREASPCDFAGSAAFELGSSVSGRQLQPF